MKKLSSKKKMRQIQLLNKNIQKMNKRKNKRVKDEKKVAEKERMLPRNRQVQNYYMPNFQSGDMGKIGCGIIVIFVLVMGFKALIGSFNH